MTLKEALKKIFSKNEKFKEMQEDVKLQRMLEQRQKSSDEREVEEFLEKRKQEELHRQVKEIHNIAKAKQWHSGFGNSDNIFLGHRNILQDDNHGSFLRGNII